jgi:hypothetical protein
MLVKLRSGEESEVNACPVCGAVDRWTEHAGGDGPPVPLGEVVPEEARDGFSVNTSIGLHKCLACGAECYVVSIGVASS